MAARTVFPRSDQSGSTGSRQHWKTPLRSCIEAGTIAGNAVDPNSRVAIVYEEFAVVIHVRHAPNGTRTARFITAYLAEIALGKLGGCPNGSENNNAAGLPGWPSGRSLCRFPTLGKEHIKYGRTARNVNQNSTFWERIKSVLSQNGNSCRNPDMSVLGLELFAQRLLLSSWRS